MADQIRQSDFNGSLRITSLYTVYDKTARDYSQIFEANNDSVAIRNYQQLLAQTPYKEDFILIHLGLIRRSEEHCSVIPNQNGNRQVIFVEDSSDGL